MRPLALTLLALLLAGCLPTAFGIEVVEPPAPPPEPPVPDRFEAEAAPELLPSELDGFQIAPSLDPTLYFAQEEGHWYRWAMNRWYLAFGWDGNWFPVPLEEVPPALRAVKKKVEEISAEKMLEQEKGREEQLRDLDERLRELEREP